jgi:hypothetical protein
VDEDGTPDKLDLAREELERAQVASFDPVDWPELCVWSFYALENAVVAAAEVAGLEWQRSHPSKVEVARRLHGQHGLADVSGLLIELNELNESRAYGETTRSPSMSAEDFVSKIETFIDSVERLRTDDGP